MKSPVDCNWEWTCTHFAGSQEKYMFDSALSRCQQVEITPISVILLTGIVSYAQELNSSLTNP